MTFTEYLNQDDPTRYNTVIINKSDCKSVVKSIHKGLKYTIVLDINGILYMYLVKNDNSVWAQDSDGNPIARSTFTWENNE